MISRLVHAFLQCDCLKCRDHPASIDIEMDGKSWRWTYAAARKQGWTISPNGKYCCAPGHEKDLPKPKVRPHKHH